MGRQGYSAAERLERLPISGYHRIIFIIIALAFFFDSMDLAMMTFLLGSIKTEFGLSTAQAGLLASSSFFGMVVGASLSGMLADRFGRKPVFQWSIVVPRGASIKHHQPWGMLREEEDVSALLMRAGD